MFTDTEFQLSVCGVLFDQYETEGKICKNGMKHEKASGDVPVIEFFFFLNHMETYCI